jgi:hypothetical protein
MFAGNTPASTALATVPAAPGYWDLMGRRVRACASPDVLAELAAIQDGRDDITRRSA